MNKQPKVDYSFLDSSITPPTTQPKSKSKSKPVKPKMNMNNAPPSMKQSKPKPLPKSKPKVVSSYKVKKPTPQEKPVSVPVMTPTNKSKLKKSTNETEYLKNLKLSNSNNINEDNKTLFNDIQSNMTELEMTPITIKKYSNIINQMKKLFVQSKILLVSGGLIDNILKYQPKLMNTISSNYAVNTQRSILSNIIMLLTYTNEKVSATKIKAVELYRKKVQLDNKNGVKPTPQPTTP